MKNPLCKIRKQWNYVPAKESTKTTSMRLSARMTDTTIFLRGDGRSDDRGDEKLQRKESNGREIISFIVLDVSGNGLF